MHDWDPYIGVLCQVLEARKFGENKKGYEMMNWGNSDLRWLTLMQTPKLPLGTLSHLELSISMAISCFSLRPLH